MNKDALKSYAPQARRDFIAAVTARANQLGLSSRGAGPEVAPSQPQGDVTVIAGQAWPIKVDGQRQRLITRIQKDGFDHTMEAVAYTWFNRLASQTSIAQILYLQGQGGDAMDEAITLIEAAAAKPTHQVATPGDSVKPVQLGQPNVPPPAAKTTKIIRAAELSGKTYLETEADVDAYVVTLKAALLAAILAGQMVRMQ